MNQQGYEVLKTEIDNMKEDIKEIKLDAKENNLYFRKVIDTLKENSVQQTEILKNQERRFTEVNNEIEELTEKIDETVASQTKWYQDFLSKNFGVVIKILIVVILILSGVKLVGIDISKLLNF